MAAKSRSSSGNAGGPSLRPGARSSSAASMRCGERLSTVNGPGDADPRAVDVGLVVEVLDVGLGGDRGVDLLLPGDAQLPPGLVQGLRLRRPASSASRGISHSCHSAATAPPRPQACGRGEPCDRSRRRRLFRWRAAGIKGDLRRTAWPRTSGDDGLDAVRGIVPLLREPRQRCAERGVQPRAERLQLRLLALPDHVDLGVVGDGLQRDVRHALVDEAVADVAVGGRVLAAPCG